jgi:hypothetical protein
VWEKKENLSLLPLSIDVNPVEGLKKTYLTGCSHNSPFGAVSKADFDICYTAQGA